MKYILAISLPLFLIDQLTKGLILKNFPDPRIFPSRVIEVVPDFFNLVRVHNTGMAFGLLNGNPYSNYIFLTIGIIATIAIIYMWRNNSFPDLITKVAVALLVAGIFGNLADRIIPGRGYVVDFLDIKLPFWHLIDKQSEGHIPSINVADSCFTFAG